MTFLGPLITVCYFSFYFFLLTVLKVTPGRFYRFCSIPTVLRIRDVYPGSRIPGEKAPDLGFRVDKIPEAGSTSKNLSIFYPKTVSKLSEQ
jgi:hypothetical protein